jgi:serine/threonine-protein kinase
MKEISVGDQLDHYRVDGLVATGTHASIFRGVDLKNGAVVAIKVPHIELELDPVFYERFRREQEIGQKLNHPKVMRVLPSEHHSRDYIVMEWVDGISLREILTKGRLPQERATHIAIGICDAVYYINSHGVVHRDLRPEHIMVDDNDHIKLINFGLASQVAAKRITFVSLAREMKTVSYASPEEIRGQNCDARSDVYSIGVMLYEMLTGRLPYENNYLLAHMNDRQLKEPTPPRKLEPTITPQMQQIVLRAMDQTPKCRYASAHEMAQDLVHMQDVVVDESTSHRSYRTTAAWNKNFLFYVVLAAIPVAIFVLMMLATHRR